MSLTSIIFTLFCYLSLLLFVIGLSYKIIQYWQTPAPLKIPIAPAPLTRTGVLVRMAAEVFLFKSLFRASKWTWFFGWIFHWALVCLFGIWAISGQVIRLRCCSKPSLLSTHLFLLLLA